MSETPTKRSSFAWLNITQFFGALNDNVFQLLCIYFLIKLLGGDKDPAVQARLMAETTIVFVLPFLLFSHAGGVLADRHSKRNVIVFTKCMELFVMIGGCIAIAMASAFSKYILYAMLFVMCTQSAIFGPSKYGIIPELVPKHKLSQANGFLVGLSYLAIILGTCLPSLILLYFFPDKYISLAAFCVTVSVVGLLASLRIEKTPAAQSSRKFSVMFPVDMFKTMRRVRSDRYLFLTLFASAYFLSLAAFIKWNIFLFGQEHLGLSDKASGFLFPMAALGIGLGALIAGKLSGRNIEFGLIPAGASGLAISCVLLGIVPPNMIAVLCLIFFLGLNCGIFIVPINAFIQFKAPEEQRGEILACQNFLGFIGVILGVMNLQFFATICKVGASNSFIIAGIFTAILALLTIRVLPDFMVRFVVIFVTKLLYRIKVSGLENVPTDKPALLVSNHVTWVDALLISAPLQRRVRFIMAKSMYERVWVKPILRLMQIIPIAQDDPPRQIMKSLQEARSAMDDGYLVCIFAEGMLTRNGNMQGFKPGLEHIVKNTRHPIIPVHIGGAWGSILSFYFGKMFSKFPKKLPYPVRLIFGRPLPPGTRTPEIRQTVLELSAQSYDMKKNSKRSLPRQFIRSARQNWFRPAIGDTTGKKLNYLKTLTGAIALGNEIDKIDRDNEMIGILLPSSVGGALTNLAITLQGRVPVNLNFTASTESLSSAIRQCEIKTVISSKAFLEKMDKLETPEGTVCLEDISPRITGGARAAALIKALFARPSTIMRYKQPGPDDVATLIFSSGSTGEPKGVMLSHHNIISNVEALSSVFHFEKSDGMCGILPFFHSFGYMATLWCPFMIGFSAFYHANPVDGSKVAEIIRENKLTVMLATPTFLLAYIRRGKKEDFASLRMCVTGAEKLKKKVADTFEEKFGLRPLEGYGATELSPVAALNLANATLDGITQVGTKEGSIGQPIPGVAVKIVDPDTGEIKAHDEEGLLMIKGPNVMLGYLNEPEKTAEVLKDGWYNTGDIAKIDSDGFVFLLDRLSRFSKIGGEMVPHIAVEDQIMKGLGAIEPVVAVTCAPDEKKGEQLIVLYTPEAGDPEKLIKFIQESDLPNLWKPKKDNYLKIETMPTLGSGKLDLKKLKVIAREWAENKPGLASKAMDKIKKAL